MSLHHCTQAAFECNAIPALMQNCDLHWLQRHQVISCNCSISDFTASSHCTLQKKKEKKSCLQALRRSTRVHESSASALKKQVGLEETSQTYHRAASNGHRSKPYSALLQGQAAVVYWLMMSKPPGDLSEKQAVYLAFWDLCFNFKPAIPDLSVGRQTSWLQYCTMGFAQETVFECNHIVCHRRNPAHRERTMSEPLVLS